MHRRALILLAALVAACPVALAQPYPNQPVHLLVPFPPGSNPDVVGRLLSPPLSEVLKQPVIIENRPGGGGMIAGTAVARSAPDGYNLLVGSTGPVVIAPLVVPNPQWQWDQVFAPVSAIGVTPVVLHDAVERWASGEWGTPQGRCAVGGADGEKAGAVDGEGHQALRAVAVQAASVRADPAPGRSVRRGPQRDVALSLVARHHEAAR